MSKGVAIQKEIKSVLEAATYFADLIVVVEDVQDIEQEIENAIAKIGVAVIVMTPGLNTSGGFAQVTAPYWDRIEVVVQIVETPTINRASSGTGKPAIAIAEAVAEALCLSTLATCNAPLTPLDPTLQLVPDPDFVIWNCRFRTGAGINPVIAQVAKPTISEASGTITLATATGGAAIYYTTNGNNPTPATGTLYTAPFASPGAGTRIKAKAYLSGSTDSDVASALTSA